MKLIKYKHICYFKFCFLDNLTIQSTFMLTTRFYIFLFDLDTHINRVKIIIDFEIELCI